MLSDAEALGLLKYEVSVRHTLRDPILNIDDAFARVVLGGHVQMDVLRTVYAYMTLNPQLTQAARIINRTLGFATVSARVLRILDANERIQNIVKQGDVNMVMTGLPIGNICRSQYLEEFDEPSSWDAWKPVQAKRKLQKQGRDGSSNGGKKRRVLGAGDGGQD